MLKFLKFILISQITTEKTYNFFDYRRLVVGRSPVHLLFCFLLEYS